MIHFLSVNFLLIFLWTDTKLIVNLELREKIRAVKKPESFMIARAKILVGRANSFVVYSVFPGYLRAALINFLSQMRRLFEGGA